MTKRCRRSKTNSPRSDPQTYVDQTWSKLSLAQVVFCNASHGFTDPTDLWWRADVGLWTDLRVGRKTRVLIREGAEAVSHPSFRPAFFPRFFSFFVSGSAAEDILLIRLNVAWQGLFIPLQCSGTVAPKSRCRFFGSASFTKTRFLKARGKHKQTWLEIQQWS